ncbi:unnamed protein product [Protopolystoma xenopodis]|uniref:Uncharacterized protein n=1 Tax=Protopolystoma xenopodis TaxID=117903 RepID=A0A448WFY9_9PLAT|nr:unnamed protein product [Protopolystoma xenopodis]
MAARVDCRIRRAVDCLTCLHVVPLLAQPVLDHALMVSLFLDADSQATVDAQLTIGCFHDPNSSSQVGSGPVGQPVTLEIDPEFTVTSWSAGGGDVRDNKAGFTSSRNLMLSRPLKFGMLSGWTVRRQVVVPVG